MRTKIIFLIISVLSIIIILFIINSRKESSFVISKLDKTIIDSLVPKANKSYSVSVVKIKGKVDQSFVFKHCNECYEITLKGEIDTTFTKEYYGGGITDKIYFIPQNTEDIDIKVEHYIQ